MAVQESFEWSLVHALTSGLTEEERERACRIVLTEKYGSLPREEVAVAPAQRSEADRPAAPTS